MNKNGFTIIELLVVIAIGVVLLGILNPVVQNCRKYSRSLICSSKIREFSLSLISYNSDHKSLPQGFDDQINEIPAGGYLGNVMLDKTGWWWQNFIEDNYSTVAYKRDDFFYCPGNKILDAKLKPFVLHGNYGVNQSICKSSHKNGNSEKEFIGKSLKISQIHTPSGTLLLSDSGYALINWHHVTGNPPRALNNRIEDKAYIPGLELNARKQLLEAQKRDALTSRHPGKTVNVGFADGHTERLKAEKLKVTKETGNYLNRFPLWSQRDY